jgi:hypothetical protein
LKEKRRKWRVGRGLLMWTDKIKSLHGRKIYNKTDLPPSYDSDCRFGQGRIDANLDLIEKSVFIH